MSDPRIIIALDFPDASSANKLVSRLDPSLCRLKVGKELFTAEGATFVRSLIERNFDVFLDLKFHDIPNTTAKACAAAAKLGVWMINLHACGGGRMMQAAREAVNQVASPPLLIAVTVLTSMDQSALYEVGINDDVQNQVLRLARLAQQSGLDGVVCSAQETSVLRKTLGVDFRLITPGIRPADDDKDDQSRTVTPAEALRYGSDYLVIGRPITRAADPLAALKRIQQSL